jgi:signal peptidase II
VRQLQKQNKERIREIRPMRVLYTTLIVYLFDQGSKFFVKGGAIPFLGVKLQGMLLGQSKPVFGHWFKLSYVENPDMAFSIQLGGRLFLVFFTLLASIGLFIYLYKHRKDDFLQRLSLAFILAGALGNLTDRIFYGLVYHTAPLFYGNVVDFIDFDLFTIHLGSFFFKFWPIFNIADASVTVGVLLLLYTSFFTHPAAALLNPSPEIVLPEAVHQDHDQNPG